MAAQLATPPEVRSLVSDVHSVGAIDIMNHAPFIAPGIFGPEFRYREIQIMVETTFASMASDDGMVDTLWGTRVPRDGSAVADPTVRVDDALARMDAAGVEIVVVTATKMWSYHYHHEMIMDYPIELVGEAVAAAGGRVIGGASYNPFRIAESLKEIETAVRDLGFKYVWFHPLSFGMAPNDRRFYPLYAKCQELDIAIGLQVGHSAEVLPSDGGRPMLVDEVAIDFPDLRINLSHTGWPWTAEFCSMMWRHPNVYGDISAYFPKSLDPELVKFMNGPGRRKLMFGTNGLDAARVRREFMELPISEKAQQRILRSNAIEFLGL